MHWKSNGFTRRPICSESCVFGVEDVAAYGDGSEIIVALLRVAATSSGDLADY